MELISTGHVVVCTNPFQKQLTGRSPNGIKEKLFVDSWGMPIEVNGVYNFRQVHLFVGFATSPTLQMATMESLEETTTRQWSVIFNMSNAEFFLNQPGEFETTTFYPDDAFRNQSHKMTQEEVTEICGQPMENDSAFEWMRFISSGILVCIVGTFGLLGNFLTCLTLRSMSRTMTLFNKLLLTLALIDTIFILAGGAFMTQHAFG